MDFEEILEVLRDPNKCEKLACRLRAAGQNSKAVAAVKKVMVDLNMHVNNPPRGIDQTTILQCALKFCDAREAFEDFRLVCRSWKNAVETCRFKSLGKLVQGTISLFDNGSKPIYNNMIASVDNIKIYTGLGNDTDFLSFIAEKAKKLKTFEMQAPFSGTLIDVENEISKLIKNSNTTLRELKIPTFVMPSKIDLPNLTKISISIDTISYEAFMPRFENLLKNAEDLKVIEIHGIENTKQKIIDEIAKNYKEHCIVSSDNEIANFLPVKITSSAVNIENMATVTHSKSIEYLKISINPETPMENGWSEYENVLTQFSSLKGVCFTNANGEDTVCFEEYDFYEPGKINEGNLLIWQERVNFLKSFGVQILDENEFSSKEFEISKNIAWRFRIFFPKTPKPYQLFHW